MTEIQPETGAIESISQLQSLFTQDMLDSVAVHAGKGDFRNWMLRAMGPAVAVSGAENIDQVTLEKQKVFIQDFLFWRNDLIKVKSHGKILHFDLRT